MKKKILFVCVHNSARSQMAEAMVNTFASAGFEAESAGIEPGKLNPIVVDAMKDMGIDISSKTTKSVQDFIKQGKKYDYVVTVCDEANAERCPSFPGEGKRVHMGFPDPSQFKGSYEEKLAQIKVVRDQVRYKILNWLASLRNS